MRKTRQRQPNNKLFWVAISLAALVVGTLLASDWLRTYRQRQAEVDRLKNEVVKTEEEILRKSKMLEDLINNEETLEMLARRDLGLIKDGEIEFRFIRPDSLLPVAPLNDKKDKKPKSSSK